MKHILTSIAVLASASFALAQGPHHHAPHHPGHPVKHHVQPGKPGNHHHAKPQAKPGKPVHGHPGHHHDKPHALPGKPVHGHPGHHPAKPQIQPGKPGHGHVHPGKPIKPVKPVQPGKPIKPVKPVHPGKPIKPVKPVQPGKPPVELPGVEVPPFEDDWGWTEPPSQNPSIGTPADTQNNVGGSTIIQGGNAPTVLPGESITADREDAVSGPSIRPRR